VAGEQLLDERVRGRTGVAVCHRAVRGEGKLTGGMHGRETRAAADV
jgi:hypothetical protein